MRLDADAVKQQVRIEDVIGQYVGLKQESANELKGLCPFHEEKTPSFSVTPSKGLFYCFGCHATGSVLDFVMKIEGVGLSEAITKVADIAGIVTPAGPVLVPKKPALQPKADEPKPQHVATYTYTDEHAGLVYEKLRFEPGKNGRKKDFKYRRKHPIDGAWVNGLKAGEYVKGRTGDWYARKPEDAPDSIIDELPDCPRPLYRLSEVLASDTVYYAEGEKDVESLRKLGLVATTTGGTTGKWEKHHSEPLRGKEVFVLPDMDEVGLKRAAAIEKELRMIAASVTVVKLPSGKDVTEYIQSGKSVEDLIRQVKQDALEKRGLLSPVEIIDLYDGGVDSLLDPTSRKPGIKTGFADLDRMTNGLHDGQLIIIGARPAMGKTAIGLNIASNIALGVKSQSPKSVAVFSLEMSRESLLVRMICARANIDSMKLQGGKLNNDERRLASGALQDLCESRLFIDDHAGTNLEHMHAKLLNLRQRAGLDIVIIDYLQLMSVKGKENRVQEVSALSRGLKLMAREFRLPFIVLSQVSRACETRPDKRPMLADLRESGSIEQDADVVGFLFREEYYKPDREDLKGCAELNLAKQRIGPVGRIKLIYLNQYTRFADSAEGWRGTEAA